MDQKTSVTAEFCFERWLLGLFCTFSVVVVFYLTLLSCTVLHQDPEIRAKVRASIGELLGERDAAKDHLHRGMVGGGKQ